MWKSKLCVQYIYGTKKPKLYVLAKPLEYDKIVVPIGFRTDFASVPSWLHWIWKPQGKYSRASVIHDYLYSFDAFNRKDADNIYIRAMKDDGVDIVTRYAFYLGVRVFGGKFKRKAENAIG